MESFHQDQPALLPSPRHTFSFYGVRSKGLFAEHMFTSLQCSYRPTSMQAIRKGNIDCIDGGIVQQFVIAGKDVGNLMFFGECLRTCDVTCSDRCHCDFGKLLSWLDQR